MQRGYYFNCLFAVLVFASALHAPLLTFTSPIQMRCDEQERIVAELKASLQRSAMEMDRKLTKQQQEYERKIQVSLFCLLMKQLCEMLSSIKSSYQNFLPAELQSIKAVATFPVWFL